MKVRQITAADIEAFQELVTPAPYDPAPRDATLAPMDEPVRIDAGVYEVYQWRGYTIQRSDQPGYTDRWFVYKERPPYMVYLRDPNGSLNTFGSVEEAAAWLGDNPDVLPDP